LSHTKVKCIVGTASRVGPFFVFVCLFVCLTITSRQPREVKNSAIMLKFGTIVD